MPPINEGGAVGRSRLIRTGAAYPSGDRSARPPFNGSNPFAASIQTLTIENSFGAKRLREAPAQRDSPFNGERTAAGRALALRLRRAMLSPRVSPASHYDPALSR
jgi:hypothetical protein